MNLFQKQPMMRKVLYALVPLYLFALYLYGLQLIRLSVIVFPAAVLTEYIMESFAKKKVSEAVLVTAMLYLLSLPPRTPWWIALTGIVFGILFAKEVFGGFGRNPFNPAIAGRLFIYISFNSFMNGGWQVPGNFGLGADALTTATPLGLVQGGGQLDLLQSVLGLRPGSLGEGMIILIILAGAYLVFTKTASWEIMISCLVSFSILTVILDFFNVTGALPLIPSLLSGSFLFVIVFMATDPISAPKKKWAKWMYGFLIGCATVIIRTSPLFPEGTSFAVLLGNTFAALFDEVMTKKVTKTAAKAGTQKGGKQHG